MVCYGFFPSKSGRRPLLSCSSTCAEWAFRPASYEPTGLGRGVEVTLKNVAGWPVYYTAPFTNLDAGNYVLFLHGSGYIKEIVRARWRFIG